MDDLRVLDSVRGDLEPLVPVIGRPFRIADVLLDGLAVDLSATTRMENVLDGVIEGQKLWADLEPILEKAERVTRVHATNLERRWRALLVDAVRSEL